MFCQANKATAVEFSEAIVVRVLGKQSIFDFISINAFLSFSAFIFDIYNIT